MINAELNYNPYLMETQIRFNGQPPRVNSLVEKYQHMNLQSWVSKIPKIFYDEMNGFYFELDFTGTQLDYEDLCNAFRKVGITDESVPIVHKENLEDRITKQNMVESLLVWLENNPNRRFNNDAFKAENSDLYDGGYSYVFLHGRGLNGDILKDMNVSVEFVDKAEELKDTDLTCTPILIYITEKTLQTLASELSYFRARPDVAEEQLFFLIGGMLDKNTVGRIIRDLGVMNPKVVETPDAPIVRKYIEVYPITAFIKEALDKLRNEAEAIESVLKQDNEKSIIKNREIHEKIDEINAVLERLGIFEKFVRGYSDLLTASSNEEMENELLHKVNYWRKQRTKIYKNDEAFAAAKDFEKDVKLWLSNFAKANKKEAVEKLNSAKKDLETEYKKAQYDEFQPDTKEVEIPDMELITSFYYNLLEIKEERYVEEKEAFLGMLFKQHQSDERQMVLETTYQYSAWRDYVANLVKAIADKYLDQLKFIYKEYIDRLAEEYLGHVLKAIEQEELIKQETESQLSEDEKKLQTDNKWLAELYEKRLAIERG